MPPKSPCGTFRGIARGQTESTRRCVQRTSHICSARRVTTLIVCCAGIGPRPAWGQGVGQRVRGERSGEGGARTAPRNIGRRSRVVAPPPARRSQFPPGQTPNRKERLHVAARGARFSLLHHFLVSFGVCHRSLGACDCHCKSHLFTVQSITHLDIPTKTVCRHCCDNDALPNDVMQ